VKERKERHTILERADEIVAVVMFVDVVVEGERESEGE
jgi:hypothetical protein